MDRRVWLLLAWLPLMGCDEMASGVLSAPTDVPGATEDGAPSVSDAPSDGKADAPESTSNGTPSLHPRELGGDGDDPDDTDPLADALDACANDLLDARLFERAYEARLCEEWMACDGSECTSSGEDDGFEEDDDDGFDAVAGCDCLGSAWSCETSYGASSELRVVVPDVSCFAVY